MTDPITPPPELVQQWVAEIWHEGTPVRVSLGAEHIATRAAQWGADQELGACCERIAQWYRAQPFLKLDGGDPVPLLRAARRPKPPSLAEEALVRVEKYRNDFMPPLEKDWEIIRRALERLQRLDGQQ
jgi:hypothetical protein